MFHFHKWVVLAENHKWKLEKCSKCGKERWNENIFASGYMPKPTIKTLKGEKYESECGRAD